MKNEIFSIYYIECVRLSYKELACYTDDFSERSYLGHFQFGKFYRGKITSPGQTQHVLVKIWEVSKIYTYYDGDNERRIMDELLLLSHDKLTTHPGMVKLYGFCLEAGQFGVVYDFKPFDSIYNLIPKDEFTWLLRMRIALKFAILLNFLHTRKCSFYKPYIVRNLDAAHIVLDEDCNPKLCDFGLITGGIFPDRTIATQHHIIGCYGYIDSSAYIEGDFSDKIDVLAFGIILLSLISKRVYTEEDRESNRPFVYEWALKEYYDYEFVGPKNRREVKGPKCSLVHQSIAAEPGYCHDDGCKLTRLGVDCVAGLGKERPTMKQILKFMLKLNVVKEHADYLGVNDDLLKLL